MISRYDANRIRRLMANALVGTRGPNFVRVFYAHLFMCHPNLRPLFPINIANQARKLLMTISVVVKNLENDAELQRIAVHLMEVHNNIPIQEIHIEAFLESFSYAYKEVAGHEFPRQEWNIFRRAIFSVSGPMLHSGIPSLQLTG